MNTPLTIASAIVLTTAIVSGCGRRNDNVGDRGSTITVLYEGDDFLRGPAGGDSPAYGDQFLVDASRNLWVEQYDPLRASGEPERALDGQDPTATFCST